MLDTAFSGFSVDDVDAARRFYADDLGLTVSGVAATLRTNLAGTQAANAASKERQLASA